MYVKEQQRTHRRYAARLPYRRAVQPARAGSSLSRDASLIVHGDEKLVRRRLVPSDLTTVLRLLRPVATTSSSVRRYVRRHGPAVQCALVLVTLAVTTSGLAYLCWQAAIDERLRLSAADPAPSGALTASLEAQDASAVMKGTVERPRGVGEREGRTSPERRGGTEDDRRTSVTVQGSVLASVGAGAVMLGGTGAAWAVLSRYRRRADEVQPPTAALSLAAVVVADDEAEPVDPRDVVEDDVSDLSTDAAADAATDAPTDEAQEDSPHEGTGPRPGGDTRPTTDDPYVRLAHDAFQEGQPGSSSHQGHDVTAGRRGHHFPAADGSGRQTVGMTPSVTPTRLAQQRHVVDIAGERLFERRAAPRVDYVHAAELHLRGRVLPITTLDLSESGLRCAAELSSGNPAELPKARDFVRVVFPAAGIMVDVSAQVAWQRCVPDGRQLGLSFRGLSDGHLRAVRAACHGVSLRSR